MAGTLAALASTMSKRSFLSCLLVLVCACGSGEATRSARSAIQAGDLERATRLLNGVEGSDADALRAAIDRARAERAAIGAKIEELLAAAGEASPNQIRERLKTLRDRTVDSGARDEVARTLSGLTDILAARAPARTKSRDQLADEAALDAELRQRIARVRGDVREALDGHQWSRAESLLAMLAGEPREFTGDLASLRAELSDAAGLEAQRLSDQVRQIEREQGARSASDWLAKNLERFPTAHGFEALGELARELADKSERLARTEREARRAEAEALAERARDAAVEPEPEVDPQLAAKPVPDGLNANQLEALAKESAAADDLAFARQCWLAASRKLFPGHVRDDYLGEAQDLRARIALRSELSEAFRADPARFERTGIESLALGGWTQGGSLRPWREASLELLGSLVQAVELSALARRGFVAEVLRGSDLSLQERALAELARMVESGDVAHSDAASIVARARGGIGTNQRWVLDGRKWVTRGQLETAQAASNEAEALSAFREASPDARDAAFAALLAVASESTVREALRARTELAQRALAKTKTAAGLKSLAQARRELDLARAAALALIFDENVYFYPYAPPEPPHTAGEYAKAQQRVDELVSAVRDAWRHDKRVKLAKDFRAACEELAGCRALHAGLRLDFAFSDEAPEYLLVQERELDEIELASFAWSAKEAQDLAYDRAVAAYNERRWKELDGRKDVDDALLPNVAEREQVRITNRYRTMLGRRALAWNPRIQVAAQGHSEYMANTGDFGHFEQGDPARRSPFDRMKLAGYAKGVSENCAMVGGDPQAAHDGWLHSSGHHRNILMAGHRELASANASNYWTQNFGSDTAFQKELPQ